MTGDGNRVLIWGYANGNGRAQLPGPTMIVNQGATVTVTLRNEPGKTSQGVTASAVSGGTQPGGSVSYTFEASRPGTYLYQSGTNPNLQVEMGLSEMDPKIYQVVEFMGPAALANTNYLSNYFSNYWFLNGRTSPDSLSPTGVGWVSAQRYGSLARMHFGDKVLVRVIGGNRDMHPFHHHGNHVPL